MDSWGQGCIQKLEMLLQGSVQRGTWDMRTRVPCYPPSPAWSPGAPFLLQSAHGEDLPVIISASCISHTQLLLLMAQWLRK